MPLPYQKNLAANQSLLLFLHRRCTGLTWLLFSLFLVLAAPYQALASGSDCGSNTGISDCDDNTNGSSSDPGSAPFPQQPPVNVGNPINLITGNKYQRELDFRSTSTRLTWQRHYNSANANFNFGLGNGWSATYLASLQSITNDSAAVLQSNGRRIEFRAATTEHSNSGESESTNLWKAALPSDGTLQLQGDYRLWSLPDGRTLRFKGPFLVQIDFPGAAWLKLYYTEQRLTTATDELGQTLRFDYYPPILTYDANNGDENNDNASLFGQAAAHLKSVTLPDNSVITYDYDDSFNLTRARFSDGTERHYHYEDTDFLSHLTGLTDRRGNRVANWGYNREGYAIRFEREGGVERVDLTYNHPTIIGDVGSTTITNSLGEQSLYTWQRYPEHGQSLLLSSSGAGCSRCPPPGYSYSYTGDFQLREARNENGLTTRWEYDDKGRATAVFQAASDGTERLQRQLTYGDTGTSGSNEKPSIIGYPSINPDAQHTVELTYNNDGQTIRITERGYSPVLDATNNNREDELSGAPEIMGYEPIERSTTLTYSEGRISSIDGPRTDVDDVVTFRYHGTTDDLATTADLNNQSDPTQNEPPGTLAQVTLPSGENIKLSKYNAFGQATRLQHNNGTPYRIEYDNNQRLVALTHNGNTVRYHYDVEGNNTGITDHDGRRTTIDYDVAGRAQRITNDIGQQLQWLYDTEGRTTGEQRFGIGGEQIRTLSLVYDQLGKLASQTEERFNYSTGAYGHNLTTYTHNTQGQLSSATNSLTGKQVDYTRNAFGQLHAITAPYTEQTGLVLSESNSTTRFGYDNKNRMTAVTDARDNKTLYWADDFGRRVANHSPDTGLTINRRDKAGNIVSVTDANQNTTTTTYDSANRPLLRSNRDGNTTFTWHPDNGKLAETTNQSTTERYEYNNEGRLTRHVREIDGHSFTTSYAYDARGRLSRKGLPDGSGLTYHYYTDHSTGNKNNTGQASNAGRLRAITRDSWFGLLQETLIGELDEDARDGTTRHVNHNGSITERQFHPDGTLKSITNSAGMQLAYQYDNNGRIISIDKNGTLSNYDYRNGNLTTAVTANATYVYQYDKLGNRSQEMVIDETGSLSLSNYSYSKNGEGNRLKKINDSEYHYSKTGTPSKAGRFNYEYNAEQRPVKVFKEGRLVAEYQYNTFGERIKKVRYRNGSRKNTYFLYDNHKLTAEINTAPDSNIPDQYQQTIYLGHTPTVRLQGGNVYSILSDHLGTPQQVEDSNRQIVWAADYSPFGKATITTETIRFNHRLPGQYLDTETGTHYNYFRDYDPNTGRYLTSDPIGLLGGYNQYAYVDANPINSFDLFGLNSSTPGAAALNLDTPLVSLESAIRIGGQLGRWAFNVLRVGALTASSSVAGPVVATALLALYFHDNYAEREEAFIQQLGYQPTQEMYEAIYNQVVQYHPLDVNMIPQYNGFNSIFRAIEALEHAQREYISNYETEYALYTDHNLDFCDFQYSEALYISALEAIRIADAARLIDSESTVSGTIEEFPIVDSEATILVTPGEPHAQIISEGFPAGIDIAVLPSGGSYIFVPADQEAAEALGQILGFPIAPDFVINVGPLLNENSTNDGSNASEPTIGESSRRPFDAENAGGPIQNLDWRDTQITEESIEEVRTHLSRFEQTPENAIMLERLEAILRGDIEPTDYDLRFYSHELRELERYRNLGVPDHVDPGYEVWNNAHTATLEDFGLAEQDSAGNRTLFHPDTWIHFEQ